MKKLAVGKRLGIEEPQLMKIIRATLHSHTEWFKLQMCKDQFEGLLWINSLKELGSHVLGDASCKSTCTQGSSQVSISSGSTRTHEDGNSPNQISSTDIGCDENAILKVMVSLNPHFFLKKKIIFTCGSISINHRLVRYVKCRMIDEYYP